MPFDPQTLAQSWPLPSPPRPIVTFGAGSIVGDAHYPAYRKGGFPIAGVYDPDHDKARALAEKWGVAAYRTVEEAASVEGAIFDLATPPAAHAKVLSALPEGVATLIQKPMGSDLAAATEILHICRDRKLKAAVNFQLRFAPMLLALKDAIAKGLIGEVVEGSAAPVGPVEGLPALLGEVPKQRGEEDHGLQGGDDVGEELLHAMEDFDEGGGHG